MSIDSRGNEQYVSFLLIVDKWCEVSTGSLDMKIFRALSCHMIKGNVFIIYYFYKCKTCLIPPSSLETDQR